PRGHMTVRHPVASEARCYKDVFRTRWVMADIGQAVNRFIKLRRPSMGNGLDIEVFTHMFLKIPEAIGSTHFMAGLMVGPTDDEIIEPVYVLRPVVMIWIFHVIHQSFRVILGFQSQGHNVTSVRDATHVKDVYSGRDMRGIDHFPGPELPLTRL